jgi:hypothetical protein
MALVMIRPLFVSSEVGVMSKRPSTPFLLTCERLLSRVRPSVRLQVALDGEGFTTTVDLALERSLPCVRPRVLNEVTALSEALRATRE